MSDAINDVLAERARQRAVEGWTDAHDDAHVDRSLAAAAACYITHAYGRAWLCGGPTEEEYRAEPVPLDWPDSWSDSWWKPKNPRSDLIRAAAMIIAEVERMDRLAAAQNGEPNPSASAAPLAVNLGVD